LPFDSWKKQEFLFRSKSQKLIKPAVVLKLATRLHLVPSLRVNVAIFLLPQYTLITCTETPFVYIYILYILYIYTGCPRLNVPDFGRVFLILNYTDITQNTYVQIWTVTEIMARDVWNFDSCYTLIDYQIHIKTGRNMWFL